MNNEKNEGIVYKALAFGIFIILAVFIVLISVSTAKTARDDSTVPSDIVDTSDTADVSDTTPDISDTTPEIPEDTTEPQTSDTTEKVPTDTTKAPDTTKAAVNTPPVDPPSSNVTAELSAFLAKYPDTVLTQSADAGQEYIDRLVFLGDSTTNGLRAYSMLSGGRQTLQVWTPYSGTLALFNVSFATIVYPETGEEITIKEAVSRKKPEYLVITLGVNGVSTMKEDYFKSEYRGMINTIKAASPDTKIICQSIFPVARSYDLLGSINNDKIRNANKWIVEVAAETGVKFVDTYSVLCDAEGWLPENYHNGDGMHLNTTSFKIELDNLRTHAYN